VVYCTPPGKSSKLPPAARACLVRSDRLPEPCISKCLNGPGFQIAFKNLGFSLV
jgi:hypothetical protein